MGLRRLIIPCLVASFGAFLLGWAALQDFAFSDYDVEAAPAFDALRAGHISGFLERLPAYGGSLILRSPFVLIADAFGGGANAAFRAAAAPALIMGVAFGLFVFSQIEHRGRWLALLLAACNPFTFRALELGHPEELIGGILCVVAVLCALRGHPFLAALALGLAIGNKPWALVAVGPVLLALESRRWQALAIATIVGGALLAPQMLASNLTVDVASSSLAATVFKPG